METSYWICSDDAILNSHLIVKAVNKEEACKQYVYQNGKVGFISCCFYK